MCKVILGTFSREKCVLRGGKYRIFFYWIQALYDLRNSYDPEGPIRNWVYIWSKGTCAEDSPVQIQSPAHCNVIGRSMTAPPPVLSPCSILPPPSSYCAFTPTRKKIRRAFHSSCYFALSTMLKTPVSRKSRKSVKSLYFQITRNLYGTDLPCFKWLFSLTLRLTCYHISGCCGRSRFFGHCCFSVSWSGSFSRRLN